MPSIPIPIESVTDTACSLNIPNKDAIAMLTEDPVAIQQMRENFTAIETWWDEVRLRGCIGATDDPVWRVRGAGQALTEDTWDEFDLDWVDFLAGGATLSGNHVVIPRTGIYSTRFQIVAESNPSPGTYDPIDVNIAILVEDDSGNALDIVAVAKVSSGSAVNVAFGANEGEHVVYYAYASDPDVYAQYAASAAPYTSLAGSLVLGSEVSGHWVRYASFERPSNSQ